MTETIAPPSDFALRQQELYAKSIQPDGMYAVELASSSPRCHRSNEDIDEKRLLDGLPETVLEDAEQEEVEQC